MKKNNLKQINFVEKNNWQRVLQSIMGLNKQINSVFEGFKQVNLSKSWQKINKIVVCGMGGSEIGADLIKSIFNNQLIAPLIINSQYTLPKFCNSRTLIIISSYSGNTEETLGCLKQAQKKHLPVFIISSGGKLATLAKKYKLASYIFNPKDNPSAQPRLGTGYGIAIFWQLCKKLCLLKPQGHAEQGFLGAIKLADRKYQPANKNNLAKDFASRCHEKMPIIVASEFLSGNAHIIANQLNESAKTMANYFIIPELNHHLLEGLVFPKKIRSRYFFIFLNSNLYLKPNQKRHLITQQILKKQGIAYQELKLTKGTIYQQSAEVLVFGSYLSFYLAQLYQVDPVKIPWVDFLKKSLS